MGLIDDIKKALSPKKEEPQKDEHLVSDSAGAETPDVADVIELTYDGGDQ